MMPVQTDWIVPDWAAPSAVGALVTTRSGGISEGVYGAGDGSATGLNLGAHVDDEPDRVRRNRERLQRVLPGPVHWLEQVHGVALHDADAIGYDPQRPPIADAAIATKPERVIAVMTADCLPVLLADRGGRGVAVAHAGWRGLAAGVIEATVAGLRRKIGADASIVAWLGPAIGPQAFEVGDEVRAAFVDEDVEAAAAFCTGPTGKWYGDLYRLARMRLARAGVERTDGGGYCTVNEPLRFYSHRRDRRSGRFASLVWLRS